MVAALRRVPGSVLATIACVVLAAAVLVAAPADPHVPGVRVAPVDTVGAGVTAVPHYDHVVVVVDENHTREQVIGNPDAPWINALAAGGANLTSSYGVTHPSQPNYLALFSGATQGLLDDSCPQTYRTPDLGSQLASANLTFAGYSETLPSAGWTGCYSGAYARKHNPWVDFPAVPAVANQPFTSFPSDYSTLPNVSFVIPNLQNDMHDGTIAQGNAWLAANLDGYVTWAKTHNSLFVLTFDEDDNSAANRIPTVFAGAHVRPGDYSDQVNHYNVLRTIEDSFGLPAIGQAATSAPILSVFGAPGQDQAPTASFTASCDVGSCAFDATASSDQDGTVASWAWDFGDGTTSTGPTPRHTYAEAGRYTVGLTVTDDQGAAGSTTKQVTGAGGFAVDTFDRTVARGFGAADVGGAWTTSGTATNLFVNPGAGTLRLASAGSQLGAVLAGVGSADTELLTRASLDKVPAGGPVYVTVQGRRVSSGNEYDARLLVNPDKTVTLRLTRLVGGSETLLAGPLKLPGITYAAGMPLRVRLQVTGTSPTTLRARAWRVGDAEPTSWQLTATDATAGLQGPGAVGVAGYLSSAASNAPITLAFGEVRARPTTVPVNRPPTAVIDASCSQLTCTFGASRSADPDGRIVRYAWDFGDGAAADGASVSHAYPVAGTYSATLTVTDDRGAAASASQIVTATAPPVNQPPTARFSTSCASRTCTFDASGSTDDEEVESWTWDFGDGANATGQVVTHTYVDGGTYPVRLTVADEYDATDTTTQSLAVAGPFARDGFGRVVDNGFGTADVGGAWTTSGAASGFAVRPGYGTMRIATASGQLVAALMTPKRTATDLRVSLRVSAVPAGGPLYVTVSGRRVSNGNEYAARLFLNPDRTVTLRVSRFVGGTETTLSSAITLPGLSYTAGQVLNVRVQASGSGTTTVRAKAWPVTSGEPAAWQVSATDTTPALQTAGHVAVAGYLSSKATNAPISIDLTSLVADTP